MPDPILVTGGLGAVGTYLVAELKLRGHAVSVMDVPHNAGPNYFRGDIGEYRQFESIVKKVKPKYVYHLAAEFGRWNGEDCLRRLLTSLRLCAFARASFSQFPAKGQTHAPPRSPQDLQALRISLGL